MAQSKEFIETNLNSSLVTAFGITVETIVSSVLVNNSDIKSRHDQQPEKPITQQLVTTAIPLTMISPQPVVATVEPLVKEKKSDKEQEAIPVRIPSGQYISGRDISAKVKKINKEGNLTDNLRTFRLASVHKILNLNGGNTVLANLRIKFLTKSNVQVEHTIPILVSDKEVNSYYNSSQIDKENFSNFYKSIRKEIQDIEPMSHYHSEPFLVYYLCSKNGKDSIAWEFMKKGLTVPNEAKTHLVSNVAKILCISIDLHSSKVICFNCAPFLKDATSELLQAIYWTLALGNLPEKDRLKKVEFNVSANTNFDFHNIQNAIFPHIPVSETQESVLVNTESFLGEVRTKLQTVGELSNRTFFRSGSSALSNKVEKLIAQDKTDCEKIQKNAGLKILQAWKKYKEKNITNLQDGIKKIALVPMIKKDG